ncbi:MAG: hypothetical protein AWU59_2447 [Methanolobus sp. T82-4]|nr:MAG: hypothetical protein AWU59_2447 [Methanolobus sp. T82-4]
MNAGKEVQLSRDFLRTLEGKSSLFLYGKAEIPASMGDLITDYCNFFDGSILHLYWSESPDMITGPVDCQITQFSISRNLTSSMIKLERLLADKSSLIIFDSLDELALELGMKTCSRFLSVLLRKGREQNRTIISFYREDLNTLDHDSEQYITRSFDEVFRISDSSIYSQDKNLQDPEMSLSRENSSKEDMSTEMEKIKDIFRLTPEEKEELDKIAGDRVREYSI